MALRRIGRLRRTGLALAPLATLLIAGCEGTFTNDLATDPPADPDIAQVLVSLTGLEFEQSDGDRVTLDFRDPEPVDLLDFVDGDPLRMFTDESLRDGDYTGVRLVIDEDEDATVVDDTGAEFPVSLVDGPFVDVDFAVEDNRRSEEALTLTLDLRQSLAFDDDTDEYTLEPVLRSVRTENAASVSGTVGVECPSGTTLAEGGAVYLYSGSDLEPDDIDGTGVEPYATTRVRQDTLGGDFTYDLRALPSGRYTLAFTCKGDADDLDQNEVLDFSQVQNVSLDSGESLELDLD